MHKHELHAETRQQIQIVNQCEEARIGDDFAAECDDERAPAERMDIGSCRTEPLDEVSGDGKRHEIDRYPFLFAAVYAETRGKERPRARKSLRNRPTVN